MRPGSEVADVLRTVGDGLESMGLSSYQLRHLRALRHCRTAAMGGHIDKCDDCRQIHISYNSCRNRHCPKCQGHKRQEWMHARMNELLPVPYFHVVFTLPQELNALAMHSPKEVYDALFDAAWATLAAFAQRKGLLAGMVAILHTWGQNLSLHPHLHCIVPGGGTNSMGGWQPLHATGKFLFAVKAMSKVFRAKYVAELRSKQIGDKALYHSLFSKEWVVYAKRPFGNTHAVIEYLGRYTHKVAISNHRIQSVDAQAVAFTYKDYRAGGATKLLRLAPPEFVRRFAQHLLPRGFVRIRHYGFLSSSWKRKKLAALQKTLGFAQPQAGFKTKLRVCPCCKTGQLKTIAVFADRGPPGIILTATPSSAC